MSSYLRAKVRSVKRWGDGISEVSLEFQDGTGGSGVVIEGLVGPVSEGDEVIANTTAVVLDLGSGGYHFVLWNLERDGLEVPSEGHIMKLRYTPLQFNVTAVEERLESIESLEGVLEGMPVVAGSLHSQLIPVALAYKRRNPRGRLIYVMTDGGSLPIAFSNTVRFLKGEGYLAATITCGNSFGGDMEAVNIFGGLIGARAVCGADAVVAMMGPGIVGTGTAAGFSGMEQAVILNAAGALGGKAIAIPRITFGDERERHYGLSHHSATVLGCGASPGATVSLPRLEGEKKRLVLSQLESAGVTGRQEVRVVDSREVLSLIEECGFRPTVMGRAPEEEPEFFMAAGAAGIIAAETGDQHG